ncbi:flavoprotein [Xylariaceae sp. FL0662B]|nr:flavoprotein [Xylariaceae sp. FL0662B]
MLQAISPTHDRHHVRTRQNSLASLTASLHDNKTHLLLAASGSVATIKLPLIIEALSKHHQQHDATKKDLSIRVILTPAASRFLAGQSAEQPPASALLDLPGVDAVYGDADEWRAGGWRRGDAILHIELRRWAHLLVVAPLSANQMAGFVGGFADGLLASVVRAWDPWGELDGDGIGGGGAVEEGERGVEEVEGSGGKEKGVSGSSSGRGRRRRAKKRIIVAPAMNTAMWRHPVTARHLRVLEQEWGVKKNGEDSEGDDGWFEVLRPQQKTLACGDVGDGAMMEWTEIVAVIEDRLGLA